MISFDINCKSLTRTEDTEMNSYTREILVPSFHGPTLFRVEERPMLDPLFDTNPLSKIQMLVESEDGGWVDVTNILTVKQEAAVLEAWDAAYFKDFSNEDTMPMFI